MTSYHINQVPLGLGLWRVNAILRSLYKEEDSSTISAKMEESNCFLLFVDQETLPIAKVAVSRLSYPAIIVICGEIVRRDWDGNMIKTFDEFVESGGPYESGGVTECPLFDSNEDDVAVILPTSGSTGPCKGAIHTHKSFLATIRVKHPLTFHKPNLWCTLPSHIVGTLSSFVVMAAGAQLIVVSKFNKQNIAKAVHDYKPGYIMAFPAFLTALTDPQMQKEYDVTSLEVAVTAGALITNKMMEKYKTSLPNVREVHIQYGLTEASPVCGTWSSSCVGVQPMSFADIPPGTVGKLWAGTKAIIVNSDTLIPLPDGERGELCIQGAYVFQGYYKNEKATRDAFIQGYFRTGDICYVDKEEFIFVVDRSKDIFKYIGNHISPSEIERVLLDHENVCQAVVFPIQDTLDDECAHVPRAVITLKHPVPLEMVRKIAEDIRKFANGRMADYKKIRGGVLIVDELPRGKTGKVSKQLTAELFG